MRIGKATDPRFTKQLMLNFYRKNRKEMIVGNYEKNKVLFRAGARYHHYEWATMTPAVTLQDRCLMGCTQYWRGSWRVSLLIKRTK